MTALDATQLDMRSRIRAGWARLECRALDLDVEAPTYAEAIASMRAGVPEKIAALETVRDMGHLYAEGARKLALYRLLLSVLDARPVDVVTDAGAAA